MENTTSRSSGSDSGSSDMKTENIIINVVLGIIALITLIFIVFLIWYRFFKYRNNYLVDDNYKSVVRIPNPLYADTNPNIRESTL